MHLKIPHFIFNFIIAHLLTVLFVNLIDQDYLFASTGYQKGHFKTQSGEYVQYSKKSEANTIIEPGSKTFNECMDSIEDFQLPISLPNIQSMGETVHYYDGNRHHYGTDFPASEGVPLYAPFSGTVSFSGEGPTKSPYFRYGNVVVISTPNDLVKGVLAHMSKVNPDLQMNQKIKAGDLVGWVGHSGYVQGSNGNHLHFELRCKEWKYIIDPIYAIAQIPEAQKIPNFNSLCSRNYFCQFIKETINSMN